MFGLQRKICLLELWSNPGRNWLQPPLDHPFGCLGRSSLLSCFTLGRARLDEKEMETKLSDKCVALR